MIELLKEISFIIVGLTGVIVWVWLLVHAFFWTFEGITHLFKLNKLFKEFLDEHNKPKVYKPTLKRDKDV